MKRNKIAMLLAMALTVTQSVAVPVAAEELTADAGQEVEMAQDDADAEVAVEADEDASEEAEAEIQDDAKSCRMRILQQRKTFPMLQLRRFSVMMLELKKKSMSFIMILGKAI